MLGLDLTSKRKRKRSDYHYFENYRLRWYVCLFVYTIQLAYARSGVCLFYVLLCRVIFCCNAIPPNHDSSPGIHLKHRKYLTPEN